MMGFVDQARVIQSNMKTYFCNLNPDIEVAWGNKEFSPKPDRIWIRFQVLDGAGQQMTVGDTSSVLHRNAGVAIAQIFGPVNKGELALREVADRVADAFRGKNLGSGVTAFTPYLTNLGVQGSYAQMNITIPYQCDALYS